MAEGSRIDAVTETTVVEVKPAKIILELTEREAQVLNALTAYTADLDPKFPEVRAIRMALKDADAPDYWDKIHLVLTASNGFDSGNIRLAEGVPESRKHWDETYGRS